MIHLGDHIRKRRLDLRLTQREVAVIIGVDETTVHNWESNTTSPAWHYWAGIVDFLGYDPFPPVHNLGERLVRRRRLFGLSQKQAAQNLGVDPTTLADWERGEHQPIKEHLSQIQNFLGSG